MQRLVGSEWCKLHVVLLMNVAGSSDRLPFLTVLFCQVSGPTNSYFLQLLRSDCEINVKTWFLQVNERRSGLSSASAFASTQTAIQGKRKLIWAPCLFVLLRIWGTIRFLLFLINPTISYHHWYLKILIVLHVSY